MAAQVLPSFFTLCSISDTKRKMTKGTWTFPTLSGSLKSLFHSDCPEFTNETLPGVWNSTSARTVFFTYSLLHSKAPFYSAAHKSSVPSAQVFNVSRNILIVSWLQITSLNKAFVTISVSQRKNLWHWGTSEMLKVIWASGCSSIYTPGRGCSVLFYRGLHLA